MEAKSLKLHGYNKIERGAADAAENLGFYALRSKNFGLDPKWFGKFSKFVGMLGSDNETERHLAADHAHKLLAKANLRWSDLL